MKRFTIRRNQEIVNTNTLFLTFNSIVTPKTLKKFYQIIPVELYVPNPLRCFNCQRFGHHESNCPADVGSVCERCGTGNYDHLTNQKSSSEKTTTQKQQNQTNTNPKQSKQKVISDRMKKGSDDPIQNHNKFGPLADDGAMDTDEGTMRPGGRAARPRSLVKAPK